MFRRTFVASPLAVTATLFSASALHAAPKKPGIVSLTFDDGLRSQKNALVIMQQLGLVGTLFVIADPNTPTTPESSPSSDPTILRVQRFSWSDIIEFHNAGWEVGAHSVHHEKLTNLSDRELCWELDDCRHIITRNTGIVPQAFASPDGAYDDRTLVEIQKRFRSHFGVWGAGPLTKADLLCNPNRIDPYEVCRLGVTGKIPPVRDLFGFIDKAMATGYWLNLVYHNILPPDQILADDNLSVRVDVFKETALYLSSLQRGKAIRVMTVTGAQDQIYVDYPWSPVARALATKRPPI